jgi:hypoxanthine-DNA glycosylase
LVSVKAGLPPIARPDARLFILGSLPGDASLAAAAYYAHPTNQFWRLLESAIGEALQAQSYEERLRILARRGIGLWDVIASADRPGSLDQAIRLAEHSRIERLLHDFPRLVAIAFNGSTAARVGRKLIGALPADVQLIDLPSSSAANTIAFADKTREWSRLAQFCVPAQMDRQ